MTVATLPTRVIDAIATAPINKEAFAAAGLPWRGHTELLAHLTGAPRVAMMFYADALRVVLATIHIPFADVPGAITRERISDPTSGFRITGRRGTVNWFSIGSKGSSLDAGRMVDTGNIDSRQMVFEPDGTFQILVSSKRQPGNWLPMQPNTRFIVVRQTFGDRRKERMSRPYAGPQSRSSARTPRT